MSTPKSSRVVRNSGIRGIHHIGLVVTDLAAAQTFYRDTTGLAPSADAALLPALGIAPEAAPTPQLGALAGPNAYLALQQFDPPVPGPLGGMPVAGPGVTHICFQCPMGRDLYGRMRKAQAQPVSRGDAPVDLGGYGVHYAYLRDPDELMFEIEQIDDPKFSGDLWLAHVALVSPDIERLEAFYEKLLGVGPYNRNPMLRGSRADRVTGIDQVQIQATWFNAGNMVLELWQYLKPATPAPAAPAAYAQTGYNKFVFEVESLDTQLRRLESLGIALEGAPQATAAGPCAFGRDPDGNLFALLELPADSPLSLNRRERISWM